ncbi:MAG TPA: YraN family protein [Janthinobacterium sp.]|nr:YraN family protein [Janthinobacterium sp.]
MATARLSDKQRAGRLGEDRALAHLQARGLSLVERNFRCKGGEIDLIMREREALVFVEVRQRAGASHGGAAASVTPAKRRRLIVAAQAYLLRLAILPPCRFDVVAIEAGVLSWLRAAIDASD